MHTSGGILQSFFNTEQESIIGVESAYLALHRTQTQPYRISPQLNCAQSEDQTLCKLIKQSDEIGTIENKIGDAGFRLKR